MLNKWLNFHDAYVEYRSFRGTLVVFFALALVEGGLFILVNYSGTRAICLDMGALYLIGIVPICRAINSLPISIGSLGVQEASYVFFFTSVGASASQAFALALVVRVAMWLSYLPGGVFYVMEKGRGA